MDIQKNLLKFKQLSYNEQLDICSKILIVAIKKGNQKAIVLLDKIKNRSIASDVLYKIYYRFLQAHKLTKDDVKIKSMDNIERGYNYLDILRKKEMEDRQKESEMLEKQIGLVLDGQIKNNNLDVKSVSKNKEYKQGLKCFWLLVLLGVLIAIYFYKDILFFYFKGWLKQ